MFDQREVSPHFLSVSLSYFPFLLIYIFLSLSISLSLPLSPSVWRFDRCVEKQYSLWRGSYSLQQKRTQGQLCP